MSRLNRLRESAWWRGHWEPAAVAALIAGSVGITLWWLGADARAPDYDEGRHLGFALDFHDGLDRGDLGHWFRSYTQYPPFVHLVGAVGLLVGPVDIASPVVAQNLFFLPLLVIGCYGAGSIAYGRRAGLLAAVFVLATPMVIDQFHEFMVDAPAAAMVAATVWLLLLSRRFESWPIAAVAGLAAGLGQLSKAPFVLFVAGFAAVLLLRGGWRNWRGILAFLAVSGAVAAPWYLEHWDQVRGLTSGALATPGGNTGGALPGTTPSRWSSDSVLWYAWNFVGLQVLVPLAAFTLAGATSATIRFLRDRRRDDYTPELLVGALSSYVAITYLSLKDARYSLPMIVFVAVLATGWIGWLARPWARRAATGALVALLAVNTLTVSFGLGGDPWRLKVVPESVEVRPEHRYIVFWNHGYLLGGPEEGGDPEGLLRAAKREGVERVAFDAQGPLFFNGSGLIVLSRIVGIRWTTRLDALTPRDLLLLHHAPDPLAPAPCGMLQPGIAIYGLRDFPAQPFHRSAFRDCPGRGDRTQPK